MSPYGPPHPVCDPIYDEAARAYIITRYRDVEACLTSPLALALTFESDLAFELSRRMSGRFNNLEALFTSLILFLEGPRHRASRARGQAILHAAVANNRYATLLAISERIVAGLPVEAEFDAVSGFCNPVVDPVLGAMFGLDQPGVDFIATSMRDLLSQWRPMMRLAEYDKREHVVADMLQRVAAGIEAVGHQFKAAPAASNARYSAADAGVAILLLTLANATLKAFLGNVLHLLATTPRLQDALRRRRGDLMPFIAECLRLHGPIRFRERVVAGGDLALGGRVIPAGARLRLMLDSAGRDPEAYPHAETFDMARQGPAPLLAFGAGAHLCLGRVLAQMQTRAALSALLEKFAIEPGAQPPIIGADPMNKAFVALPLRLRPLTA